ncbi:NAD(P)H-binding protein [Bacteroidota bacterium]|nr:NAD(P)H-binding protein [Bacteroidota bacterium]
MNKNSEKIESAIFGATGLIGQKLVKFLKQSSKIKKINLVVRSAINLEDEKVKIHKIDLFKKSEIFNSLRSSQLVFLTIGTTMSKVKGDKEKYKRIDLGITKDVADSCIDLGIEKLILVSSSGADLKSKSFYLNLKGKIEKYVTDINLKSVHILRPSLLLGKRSEKRFGERIAQMIMPKISFLMPSKYRPISAEDVAKAMVQLSVTDRKAVKTYHYREIIDLSNEFESENSII